MSQQDNSTATLEKLDARQIRSREALHRAFYELLQHKPLEQISIREIAATAGIGHATFYRHFATKEALLVSLGAEQLRGMVDLSLPLMDNVDTQAACLALANYIDQHRTIWRTLMTSSAVGTVKKELLRISIEVASQTDTRNKPSLPEDLNVRLAVSSILETLEWWLEQQQPMPAEEIAGYLNEIITT